MRRVEPPDDQAGGGIGHDSAVGHDHRAEEALGEVAGAASSTSAARRPLGRVGLGGQPRRQVDDRPPGPGWRASSSASACRDSAPTGSRSSSCAAIGRVTAGPASAAATQSHLGDAGVQQPSASRGRTRRSSRSTKRSSIGASGPSASSHTRSTTSGTVDMATTTSGTQRASCLRTVLARARRRTALRIGRRSPRR